ncbi:Reticulon-4-interacting protein 1, mitochondrial [Exaiptasia diaphana]|nr:Reticulon-4-interacting protein 1, mitochondrial [Exaiptasia diaphana]
MSCTISSSRMFNRLVKRACNTSIPALKHMRWLSSNPGVMQCWSLDQYGGNEVLQLNTVEMPSVQSSADILVKVHAASVNPFDIRMRNGYGSKLLNLWRKTKGASEFPLVLGRDFSGVVVKTGKLVRRFRPGDEVWGSPTVPNGGTHTQYLVARQDEISHKPGCLSHVEAASLPYVACTVWVALVSRAGLKPDNCFEKRILVYGGSGGIGTLAIQLLKAWGAHVTTTCSTGAIDLVKSLGADHIVDYKINDVEQELRELPGFDVILDPFGYQNQKMATNLLSFCTGAVYVNLAPPLLNEIDRLGLGKGVISSGQSLVSSFAKKALFKGGSESWAFAIPNPGALNHISKLCEEGKIRPVVQEVFPFNKTPDAFAHLEAGHSRGKTVIQMEQPDEKLSDVKENQ